MGKTGRDHIKIRTHTDGIRIAVIGMQNGISVYAISVSGLRIAAKLQEEQPG